MMRTALAVCLLCSAGSTQAGTVTGTCEGLADIAVQQAVDGQQVGPTVSYENLPATLDFTITTGAEPYSGTFAFSLDTNVYSLNSATLPLLSLAWPLYTVTFINNDGSASAGLSAAVYHAWYLEASVQVTDPLVTAQYVYQAWDFSDTGTTYTVSFTTDPPTAPLASVPEPSSIAMMAIAVFAILIRLNLTKKA
jgi:PEP-CTERM motif